MPLIIWRSLEKALGDSPALAALSNQLPFGYFDIVKEGLAEGEAPEIA